MTPEVKAFIVDKKQAFKDLFGCVVADPVVSKDVGVSHLVGLGFRLVSKVLSLWGWCRGRGLLLDFVCCLLDELLSLHLFNISFTYYILENLI